MAYYNNQNEFSNHIAAISDGGKQMTYGQIHLIADEIGKLIGQRCLVFSFCENTLGSLCGYLAFLKYGIVPLLLKRDMEAGLRKDLVMCYRPAYLYMPEMIRAEYSELTAIYEGNGYVLLKTGYPVQKKMNDKLALLLTTSGSTGSPKLVRQSYQNIQSNAESIAAYLKLDETERPITTLPMNYTYGLSIMNSHLLVGATVLMTEYSVVQSEFWKFFEEQKATSFGGVPYTYEILKKLKFFKRDLISLHTMTQAGGKLMPELHREFAEYANKHGISFIVMYGQTEATARMAYLPADRSLEKYGSMGIAIPGGRLWLKGADENEILGADIVGELVYEGPNVTLGYAQCEEDLQLDDENNGVLETGDMARRDEDGFYYIVGRKKRFLKVYGNRLNLDETERMIKAEFLMVDCACAGVDDQVYIFTVGTDELLQEKIKNFLEYKTGLHRSVFRMKKISGIPKNEAGKTLYREFEKYYDGI